MTRKRFCKKLMALGADRNKAARLASRVVQHGLSYKEEYPWASNTVCFGSYGISTKNAERAMMEFAAAFRAAMIELDPAIALALSPTPSMTDKQQ